MKKSLVLVAALALSSLIASAKTYDITLDTTAKVGPVQLKKGDYRVKVDGANAIFIDTGNHQSVATIAKVDTVQKKFQDTAVESKMENGMQHVIAIDLGGSHTKLEFN